MTRPPLRNAFKKAAGLFACLLFFGLMLPSAAHAAINTTIDACAQNQKGGFDTTPKNYTPFTEEIVACVDYAVRTATGTLMGALSSYMSPVVGAVCVVATVLFGIRMLGGEPNIINRAGGFLIRMWLVVLFSVNLNGYADNIFNAVDQLASLGSGGPPWVTIDIFLNRIFGFAPNLEIYQGLTGMIGMELFSSSVGVFVCLISLVILLQLLLFTFRVVYTYVSAIVIVAFMIAISPIVIPSAIFSSQEHYFRKWVDIICAAAITPMVMFACIGLFVGNFNTDLDRIFVILGSSTQDPHNISNKANPDLSPYWKDKQHAFSMMMGVDPAMAKKNQSDADVNQKSEPAVQTNLAPTFSQSVDAGSNAGFNGIDFGPNNIDILQQFIIALLPLWIFVSLMQTMLALVPSLCNNIAGSVSGVVWEATEFEKNVKKVMSASPKEVTKLKDKITEDKMRMRSSAQNSNNPGGMFSGANMSSFFGNLKDTFGNFNKDKD